MASNVPTTSPTQDYIAAAKAYGATSAQANAALAAMQAAGVSKQTQYLAEMVAGGHGTETDMSSNQSMQGFSGPNAPTYQQSLDQSGVLNAPAPSKDNTDLNAMDVNPQLTQLGDAQTKLASDFQNNIPEMASTFADQVSQINKKNLASSIENNTTAYNSRGLLYSGGLVGANAASQQDEASKQADQVATENSQLQTTSNSLNNSALGTKAAIAGEQNSIKTGQQSDVNQYLGIALGNAAAQNAAVAAAASGVGNAAGGLLAASKTNAATTTPTTDNLTGAGSPPSLGVNYNDLPGLK